MLKAMDIICGPPEAAGLTFLVVKRHSNDVTYTYTARVQCSVCWRHWNGHEQRRRRLLLMLLNQFLFGEAQSDPLHLQLDNAGKNPIATRVCVCVLSVWVCALVCVAMHIDRLTVIFGLAFSVEVLTEVLEIGKRAAAVCLDSSSSCSCCCYLSDWEHESNLNDSPHSPFLSLFPLPVLPLIAFNCLQRNQIMPKLKLNENESSPSKIWIVIEKRGRRVGDVI